MLSWPVVHWATYSCVSLSVFTGRKKSSCVRIIIWSRFNHFKVISILILFLNLFFFCIMELPIEEYNTMSNRKYFFKLNFKNLVNVIYLIIHFILLYLKSQHFYSSKSNSLCLLSKWNQAGFTGYTKIYIWNASFFFRFF